MFSKSARFYDAIYSFKDYPAEADLVTRYVRDAAPDASTLLDVACGTGLHMEHLRRNFIVEGVDLDPSGISSFTEDHVLALFTREEYEEAFTAAGLEVRYEPDGLMGRGNYTGRKL